MQGDGTALVFQDEPRVFTMSVHGEGNFPARKQRSDLDVPLPDGTADDEYLRLVTADSSTTPLLHCQQHVTLCILQIARCFSRECGVFLRNILKAQ